jgi:hypothetical protein
MRRLPIIVDTQARTQRFKHRDVKTEMVPFQHVLMLSQALEKQEASIMTDRNLSNDGKDTAIKKVRATTRTAITEWHEQRLKNIDADLLEKRAALLSDNTVPDPKRVDLMASQLRQFTLQEIAVFYSSATEPERRVMEAASVVVGRMMMKSSNGLEWKTPLEPDMVHEAIMARAEATNPAAAEQVRELSEIRAMQVTIAGVALAEIEPS